MRSMMFSSCARRYGLRNWMWRKIDLGLIDRLVVSTASMSTAIARRLGSIDLAFDRLVVSLGSVSIVVARRLGADGHCSGSACRVRRDR